MEQQPDHARHEENRNENGHQGGGNGDDGEAHFTRAAQRGFEGRHTVFHMSDDVFKHHNRIVHHQAHRQGQAQERDVVQAVVQAPEQGHRAHQRDR